jgi:hypothetical protein
MSVPFFVVAIAIALIVAGAAEASALAASRRAGSARRKEEGAGRPVDPERLAAAVRKVVADERDPAKLDEAASKLEAAGQPAAAAAARERAAELRSGKARSKSAAEAFSSPLPGVPRTAWNRYVHLMAVTNPETVSAGNQLGMFQVGYRRLADLGYVDNLRKVDKNGRTVWVGDFKAPLTLGAFLKDPVLQYEAFAKAALADRKAILARHGGAIGKTLAGKAATLSGLLAVAYNAGLAGLGRWLSGKDERARTPRTTAVYQKATGLF